MPAIQLTANIKDLPTLNEFKQKFRKEVLEKSLDRPLFNYVQELKKELFYIVNEQIRNIETTEPGKTPITTTEEVDNFNQPKINIPKADETLLKFLTGIDLQKQNKDKYYTTPEEPALLRAFKNVGSEKSSRVTLKMFINPEDTYEIQQKRAIEFINSSVFAIPSESGKMEYYMNPGLDLSKYVKIRCSHKGLSGKDRFEKDKNRERKGTDTPYAEWTVYQSTIENVIKKQFIKLSDILEPLKEGEIEEVKDRIKAIDKGKTLKKVGEQVTKLDKKEKVAPDVESYTNIIALIKGLKVQKKVTKETIIYELVSDFGKINEKSRSFLDEIQQHINIWAFSKEVEWFTLVLLKAIDFITKFEKKHE